MIVTWKSRYLLIPKSAESHHQLMSLATDGSVDRLWNRVPMKDVLDVLLFLLMIGRCTHWEDLDVRCSAFRRKVRSTNVRFVTPLVLCPGGRPNTRFRRSPE